MGLTMRQPPPKPRRSPLIVIDAGHGGKDFGAKTSIKPVSHEKDLTLSTAHMLNSYLLSMGFRTFMVRVDDSFIGLKERAERANRQGPALFVSIHYNSAPNAQAHGIEVYYYDSEKDKKRSKKSKTAAGDVLDYAAVQTGAKARAVKHGNFAVIRETGMPAILVECGFLTNDEEAHNIKTAAYMKRLAAGIAKGLRHTLDKL